MSFTIPQLDTVTAPQLLDELVRRIPHVSRKWTEYNESDPGITLLEMLTWLVEATGYEANAVPFESYRNMLRLVLGLAISTDSSRPFAVPATQGLDPAYAVLQQTLADVEQGTVHDYDTLQHLTYRFRTAPFVATTTNDLEVLALETNDYIDFYNNNVDPKDRIKLHVGRAYVLYEGEGVDLYVLEKNANEPFSNYTSVSLARLSMQVGTAAYRLDAMRLRSTSDLLALRKAVWRYLTPRVPLGHPISIYIAGFTPIDVTCKVRCLPRENAMEIAQAVAKALINWLQPSPAAGLGIDWRYGDVIARASVLPALSSVRGIDRVEKLTLDPTQQQLGLGVGPEYGGGGKSKGPTQRPGLPLLRHVDVTAVEAES